MSRQPKAVPKTSEQGAAAEPFPFAPLPLVGLLGVMAAVAAGFFLVLKIGFIIHHDPLPAPFESHTLTVTAVLILAGAQPTRRGSRLPVPCLAIRRCEAIGDHWRQTAGGRGEAMTRRAGAGPGEEGGANRHLERIRRVGEGSDLLDVLAERLTPTDLQSLLLEVYRRRAERQTPARLREQYESNRFVRPSPVDPRTLLAFDHLAFALAAPAFEPVELSPVCPLGTSSTVATVSQNNAVATARNTEVVADSTNVLALECAVRRRVHRSSSVEKGRRVRLSASHRLLRAQNFSGPATFAHFRLFGLCSAGRDEGSRRFELEEIAEHVGFYLRLLSALTAEEGYAIGGLRVALTDLGGIPADRLRAAVADPLAARFPAVSVGFDPERTSGRGYYETLCFHLYATDPTGRELHFVDGGFTAWTRKLLSDQKERLLISGIGSERVCSAFRREMS